MIVGLLLVLGSTGASSVPITFAKNVFILPQPPAASVWVSAVRLRNGDQFYISNRTEEAVVNNNLYLFQSLNLYYYQKATDLTLFLTYLIPGHAPRGLFLQHSYASQGIEDESGALFITTASCILKLLIGASDFAYNPKISIETGHCYEGGVIRDGPSLFARYNEIRTMALLSSCDSCVSVVWDAGHRLCLLMEGTVSSYFFAGLPEEIGRASCRERVCQYV